MFWAELNKSDYEFLNNTSPDFFSRDVRVNLVDGVYHLEFDSDEQYDRWDRHYWSLFTKIGMDNFDTVNEVGARIDSIGYDRELFEE